ncbi:MAG: hypothetical protein JWM28_4358 [Chitinophagaceae bacterium]|nr:hypothetical protein [Chitinophagaceae bacterium]
MKAVLYLISLVIVSVFLGCSGKTDKMFKSLDTARTGIGFSNKLNYNDSLTVLDFEYMFNGAGVALLDVNKDGLTDVFFTGNMVSAKLYLNKGNMKFEDITEQAGLQTHGWCYGASVVDINQDGYPDIYLCKAGNRNTPPDSMRNLFFINNGNNTFVESAKKMGLDDDGYDIQAAFFDYDHDGDPDMYLLRNSFVNYNRNTARAKQIDGGANSTDRLFRNNGDGSFTNVSKEAGITIEGFGLGVNICDINNDSWPDVYVSNDFLTNDLVWINNQNGTFTNMADKMLRHTTYNAMGNDVADFNNDGKEDIVEVDMLPPDNKRWKLTMMGNVYEQFQQDIGFGYQPQYVRNSLQLNNGDGTFSEIGQLSGIAATEWSWAPLFADFDNDGLKDLFVANGYRQDVTNLDFIIYGKRALFMGTPEANRKDRIDMLQQFHGIKVPNYLFKNKGDLTFKNMAADWGLDDASYSNGAAYGDLDNDGDLDLVINNIDQPASVYENQLNQINPDAKWLRINFKGPEDNRDGLGTKVYIWQGTHMQYLYFSPYRGYLSTVEPYLHFGVQNKTVDSLKVVWPDGKEQHISKPAVNNLLTLAYRDAHLPDSIKVTANTSLLFTVCNKELQVQYKHKEDEFVDFKLQPLLPHFLSHEGPGISVGDVNGDGLEDFFVGGAAGSKGNLFIQQTKGHFAQHPFADSNLADNMGSLLFDADHDGDNDLYVVNGGVCAKKNGDTVYRHALHLNDGKGNFSLAKNALPVINTSGSSVIGADYDHDGDLDLFVGGRVSPGDYPLAPESFLLRNDSKNGDCSFTNVTNQSGISPATLGMVTSALWTDFDNDGWQDLVVVGEFMPVRFFKNVKGIFKEVTSQTGLQNTSGWWNSIVAGDFDNDGDIDYVAGNLGLNGPYKATGKEPVCIYAKDYDKNGRLDPIMCHYSNGIEYIVHARDDINKQITPMRGRFKDYISYARATFRESFASGEVSDAYVVKAETFASAYIENLGDGKFALHNLPLQAQFAPIYGMACKDVNGDGNLDVVCVGNSYATEVQTGRYDAQGSVLLIGNGKGNFMADKRQFNVIGDNKSLSQLINANGSSLFLVGSNADSLHVYHLDEALQKVIAIEANDAYAIVTARNGMKCRQEFYYGNTYLSQSSRRLTVAANIQSVVIYNNAGKKREFNF